MPIGPGKYDDECTVARESTSAQGAALIIIKGDRGTGFSVQGSLQMIATLPDILEQMAREMRRSMSGE